MRESIERAQKVGAGGGGEGSGGGRGRVLVRELGTIGRRKGERGGGRGGGREEK